MSNEQRSRVLRAMRAWTGMDQEPIAGVIGVGAKTLHVAEKGRRCSDATWTKALAYYRARGITWQPGEGNAAHALHVEEERRPGVLCAMRAWTGIDQAPAAQAMGIAMKTLLTAEKGRRCSNKTWDRALAYYRSIGIEWRPDAACALLFASD